MENDSSHKPNQIYDCIIAGAGAAGLLSAARLCRQKPDQNFIIIEKEKLPGGRLGYNQAMDLDICFGFGTVSHPLYEFISNTLNQDPDSPGIEGLVRDGGFSVGTFAGSQWVETSQSELISLEGARKLDRSIDAKSWQKYEDLILGPESEEKDLPLQKAFKIKVSEPSYKIFHFLCSVLGMPDTLNASLASIRQRFRYFCQQMHAADFSKVWQGLISSIPEDRLTRSFDNQIVEAKFSDGLWHLATAKGSITGKKLLVAQSPWQAIDWLDSEVCPAALLDQAWKTQPCSAVAIFAPKPKDLSLPRLSLIPGDDCYLLCQSPTSLSFQCSLEYESSLDAPSVVKAIKKLRRARSKINKKWPALAVIDEASIPHQHEHIGLSPICWSPATSWMERRIQQKIQAKDIQSDILAFCGDSYDGSADPDANLIQSVLAACAAFE